MLVAEHWPQMPELWQQNADARLTERLYLSPICDEVNFPYQERTVAYLASEDRDADAVADALTLSPHTVKNLFGRSSRRIRNFMEDMAPEPLTEEETKQVTLHGLVYILLDSGQIPVGNELERVGLVPREGLFLKSLACGNSLGTSAKIIDISESHRKKYWQPAFEEKMGAKTAQGMVGNAFRMGLFVPSTSPRPFKSPKINVEGEKA